MNRVLLLLLFLSLAPAMAQINQQNDEMMWSACESVAAALTVLSRGGVMFTVEGAGMHDGPESFGRIVQTWRSGFGLDASGEQHVVPFGLVVQVANSRTQETFSIYASVRDQSVCLLREDVAPADRS